MDNSRVAVAAAAVADAGDVIEIIKRLKGQEINHFVSFLPFFVS